MNRLHEALVLWRHLGKTDFSTEDPGGERIQLNLPTGATFTKPLLQCTIKELVDANAWFKQPGASGLSDKDLALEKVLQLGMAKLAGEGGHGSVHLSRKQGGLFMSLGVGMYVDDLGKLVALLKRLG